MKIGIDIDDTIAYTVKSMIKYADKYDIEVLGKQGTNGNMGLIKDRYYLKVLYGWTDEQKFNFFDLYYKNILEDCIVMPDVAEIINKLKHEGHEIYFATARLDNIAGCDTYKITYDWLVHNNINFDYLIVNAKDKLSICNEQKLDIFIEDSFVTCQEISNNGIKSILMTTMMNQNIDSGDIKRVSNWHEIYEYINKIK